MSRARPAKDQGERSLKASILDEMETSAKARVKGNNRIALSSKLRLDWSHKEEGYYYMWATDSESYPISLQQMCDAGYTFVRHEAGSMKGDHVIQNSKGCQLYLMRCPVEFHLEDEKAKLDRNQRNYQDIMRVGEREYAGESKELGKGKVATHKYEESPDAISLMSGE